MNNTEVAAFFEQTQVSITSNTALRDPQKEAYSALREHFQTKTTPCYVQLPVGCGKTGLMGITPFGIATGRVLIVAPNLTIKKTILDELDISKPDCFYPKRGVFQPTNGPFISELKTGANLHDCDDAHLIVANIQQFAGETNRWYEQFPPDYFQMILVDEGHHGVADTWMRLFTHFADAKVASFTATPLRSDGRTVLGERIYAFSYARSMMLGYISPIDAVYVKPREIQFTVEGESKTFGLAEVLEMREHDWFSRGIALGEECNRNIAAASIQQLNEVRKHGGNRQIIASACSIRHATQIAALYHEYGLKCEVLHSNLSDDEKDRIEQSLRSGVTDAVAQVRMLGEGYDLGTLSVAAIFRPYRSLSPFIQFLGRILRLAEPAVPHSPTNRVYVVSHVGLNDERWWTDFTNFDKEDQNFFVVYLGGGETEISGGEGQPRMTLRPFMRVLSETVESYLQKGYLKEINESLVQDFMETLRSKGFDPAEFGFSEDIALRRLQLAAEAEREIPAARLIAQPQRVREALRQRVYQDARSIADTVLNRLALTHMGKDLLRHFPGRGNHNVAIVTSIALAEQNKIMKVDSGGRESASRSQFEDALAATADIADRLTKVVSGKLEKGNASA